MGYLQNAGTARSMVARSNPTALARQIQPGLGAINLSALASGATSGNPLSIISALGFGSDRNQKVPIHKAMIQKMYDGAMLGDLSYGQKLKWCITGDYNENKPFAAALYQQLATNDPKMYAAVEQAGAWPQPKGVDIDINNPPVPNAALAGTVKMGGASGGILSALGGGGSSSMSGLILPAAILGAVFLFKGKR